jgi:hypothetical protein
MDSRIYVREDDAWSMKGRYSRAIQLRQELPWEKDAKGKPMVSLLAVSLSSSL